MRYSIAFAALAAAASAQTTASITASVFSIETTIPEQPADALDFDGIAAIPDPTYTEIPNLAGQDIAYATASAISAAALEIIEDPLTVFPADPDVAMNSEGESDDSAVEKRALTERAACSPASTFTDSYGIDVSSYAAFKADSKIASVANAAPTPAGYYQNSKNLLGAQSAYGYLGYAQVKTYDVQACATKCSSKTGCLGFNIYFERAPTVTPSIGGTCDNPPAFANIKCSFWGSALEDITANNYGQWQSKFQVAIAGSNSYTSSSLGGPIDGCGSPLKLDTAIMNAPLRDCQGTWTYMGYKLLTSGPYEPRLCKAACDAQTAFNKAHPPTNGDNLAICSGFGSYSLTMTNKTGVYPQGQMCTFYTSGWGKQYAVNKVAYNDGIGAKYTYSTSLFYNVTASQPTCPVAGECAKPWDCSKGEGILSCSKKANTYCFMNTKGLGTWATDRACVDSKKCTTDADCPSSDFCSTNTCCGQPVCFPRATCANPLVASRLFRVVKARQEETTQDASTTECLSTGAAPCDTQE